MREIVARLCLFASIVLDPMAAQCVQNQNVYRPSYPRWVCGNFDINEFPHCGYWINHALPERSLVSCAYCSHVFPDDQDRSPIGATLSRAIFRMGAQYHPIVRIVRDGEIY